MCQINSRPTLVISCAFKASVSQHLTRYMLQSVDILIWSVEPPCFIPWDVSLSTSIYFHYQYIIGDKLLLNFGTIFHQKIYNPLVTIWLPITILCNLLFYHNFLMEFESHNIISMRRISPEECLPHICTVNCVCLVRFHCRNSISFRIQVCLEQWCFLKVFILDKKQS